MNGKFDFRRAKAKVGKNSDQRAHIVAVLRQSERTNADPQAAYAMRFAAFYIKQLEAFIQGGKPPENRACFPLAATDVLHVGNLISLLADVKNKYGNVPVLIADPDEASGFYPILKEGVTVEEDEGSNPVAILDADW